jgi:hypothetical protein
MVIFLKMVLMFNSIICLSLSVISYMGAIAAIMLPNSDESKPSKVAGCILVGLGFSIAFVALMVWRMHI